MNVTVAEQASARRLFMAMIAGRERGGYLELRCKGANGWRQEFHAVRAHRDAADSAGRLAATTDVYVGAAVRDRKGGTKDHCGRSWAVRADLDTPAAVAALERFDVPPTFILESGSRTGPTANLHVWFALKRPLSGEQRIVAAHKRLADALGGDMRTTDHARVMRVPGTLNHKTFPARPVLCVHASATVHAIEDIIGDPTEPPVHNAPATSASTPVGANDPLRWIPGSEYIPALTGRAVGRDQKVQCPFHADGDERTPSLHAFDDPERGWFCFGCDTGGSIIDFASRMYRIEPRGRGYREIRRRLAADLLPYLRGAAA